MHKQSEQGVRNEHGHCSIENQSERGPRSSLSSVYADKNLARDAQGTSKQAGRYNQGRIQLTDAAIRSRTNQARTCEAPICYF